MEAKVIFRDYQEQQAQDHNDLQTYTERSIDHIVLDAVTSDRRFAGLNCFKTGQAEVQISPGRLYDVLGAVYDIETTTVQSMVSYLAAAYSRYILLCVTGTQVETDIEERDYLIDVTTGATEPRAVATTLSRSAVLTFTNGVESGEPIKPAVPIGQCAVAYILCDTTQVVSIEMIKANLVTSTDSLNLRVNAIELFDSIIGPKVAALASDLADLAAKVALLGNGRDLQAIAMDLARVKASLKYPVTSTDYGTDWFLETSQSDIGNTLMFGYDAKIEEGCRFGDANADEFEISLFSANDPNAAYSNGLLLPKYYEVMRLATATQLTPDTTLGIAQYGYQTTTNKVGYMSRTRLRYGGSYFACSNGQYWDNNDIWGSVFRSSASTFNPTSALYPDTSGAVVSAKMSMIGQIWYDPANPSHEISRTDNYWVDMWDEPFIYAVTDDHVINGAFVAQSFLVPNDIWATSVRVYIAAKGAAADINVTIMSMTSGVPNPDRCVVTTVYSQANIVVGWNTIPIPPTFLAKGSRYAVALVSSANHSIGMVNGQQYLDGTFFYSTDGIYYQGDLTKDLMLQIWGARFYNSQVTIEFAPINLDGGFSHVDITAEMWVPASTNYYWEMRPNGSGEWQPLVEDNTQILALAPPLAQFRARFDGTMDMQPAIRLTGSRVYVSRAKTAFTHVTPKLTLATSCTQVTVLCVFEAYDPTPHTHGLVMRTGPTLAVIEPADFTVTVNTDKVVRRWERTYTFNVSPGVTNVCFIQTGTTNSAQMCYHVAERTFYSH